MQIKTLIWLPILVGVFYSCNNPKTSTQLVLPSPDSNTHIYFNLNDGEPYYLVYHKGKKIIDWSLLGLELQNKYDFSHDLTLIKTASVSHNSGETRELEGGFSIIQDYNELKLFLLKSSMPEFSIQIVLKTYNNGIGIMYILPGPSGESSPLFYEDKTQINFAVKKELLAIQDNYDTLRPLNQTIQKASIKIPAGFKSNDGMEVIITEKIPSMAEGSVLVKRTESNNGYHIKPEKSEFFKLNRTNEGFASPMRTIIFNDLTKQPHNK